MSILEHRRELINTHVFVVGPNNSGTTLMKTLLARSRHSWSLEREGQFAFGYKGPVSAKTMIPLEGDSQEPIVMEPLTWAACDTSIQRIRDRRRYDWKASKKAWYLTASSSNPASATVFVEKTPAFLLIVEQLIESFEGCRFIFMARNPYATVEGIVRRRNHKNFLNSPEIDLTERAALHVLNCLRVQKRNIEIFTKQACFISYEKLCDDPQGTLKCLSDLVPELNDLDLYAHFGVKGEQASPVNNRNEQQIHALSLKQRLVISSVFKPEQELLSWFGYELYD